jgi:hypothetical protein
MSSPSTAQTVGDLLRGDLRETNKPQSVRILAAHDKLRDLRDATRTRVQGNDAQ